VLRAWINAVARTIEGFSAVRSDPQAVVFLDQRWRHHGAHSGYLIAGGSGVSIPRENRLLPYPISRCVARIKQDGEWEQRLIVQLMLRAGHAKVLHLVDGDFDTWVYRTRAKWLDTRITATFHQTEDRLADIARCVVPGSLDGIVCVSRVQMPFLKHLVPEGRCVFIPHGVDTDFFSGSPPVSPADGPLLLAVGAHRRDFKTLIAAAKIIKSNRSDVRFRLIGPKEVVRAVAQEGILEVMSNLSDTELRDAYRESYMLFLPLEAATANNALLESMASARPAVITDLPAIREYTSADAALFCNPGDAQSHADAALRLLSDESLALKMGQAAHDKVQEFSWVNVRSLLIRFLVDVAN
jgi:glycosyltransferase involved in cell wall biosynthesis